MGWVCFSSNIKWALLLFLIHNIYIFQTFSGLLFFCVFWFFESIFIRQQIQQYKHFLRNLICFKKRKIWKTNPYTVNIAYFVHIVPIIGQNLISIYKGKINRKKKLKFSFGVRGNFNLKENFCLYFHLMFHSRINGNVR